MPYVNCKREGCTRRTSKVERGFCGAHWRTEKKPLEDRRCYDKCQVCDANCAKGASHCHLHSGNYKQAKEAYYQKVKNDPKLMAARRTQQVLANYKRDFPDDTNQPKTSEEAAVKRILHQCARAKCKAEEKGPEALAIYNRYMEIAAPPEAQVASNARCRLIMHRRHTQGVNEDARRMGFEMVDPENYSAKNRLTDWVCLTCGVRWEAKWATLKNDPSSRMCHCIADDELAEILGFAL